MLIKPSDIQAANSARTPGKPVDRESYGHRGNMRETSYANETVTPEVALSVTAVMAAFTILAEDISSLPLILYRRDGRIKTRDYDNPYYALLHDAPNPEHTSMIFRELMVAHLLGWGNFYAQLIINGAGDVEEMWPLRPDRMTVKRVKGEKLYDYVSTEGKQRVFFRDEILHIPAFGFDGLIGYSRIALARNAIGLAMSTERYGSKFFANDARPGVVLTHPSTLSDEAYDRIKKSWNENHQGADKAHNADILEEGMDLKTIGLPPEDSQFLETRKFQVTEIARIFRVPPHMIGDVEKSTSWGTGIDSQEQGYVNHNLRPWTRRIEQSLKQQVLLPEERKNRYWEHLFDDLQRGDLVTRYGAYAQAITNGIMSPNEVRERENMNPYPGGDVYLTPLNMTSSPRNTGTEPQPARRNVLATLWHDAVQRAVKRETNDVRGAARRFLAKGQPEAFQQWLSQFYEVDHPEFLLRIFEPILQAQKNLCGSADGWLEEYVSAYSAERKAQVEQLQAAELESEIDEWTESLPGKLSLELENFYLEDDYA